MSLAVLLLVIGALVVTNAGSWSTRHLSVARAGMSSAATTRFVFFAGGQMDHDGTSTYYTNVDIYDTTSDTWSLSHLSEARSFMKMAVMNDVVFFISGFTSNRVGNSTQSRVLDIYNTRDYIWQVAQLPSTQDYKYSMTTDDSLLLFYYDDNHTGHIDIYNSHTTQWSQTSMDSYKGPPVTDIIVEMYGEGSLSIWSQNGYSYPTIPYPRAPKHDIIVINPQKIILLYADGKIDIYNSTSQTWTTPELTLLEGAYDLTSVFADKTIFIYSNYMTVINNQMIASTIQGKRSKGSRYFTVANSGTRLFLSGLRLPQTWEHTNEVDIYDFREDDYLTIIWYEVAGIIVLVVIGLLIFGVWRWQKNRKQTGTKTPVLTIDHPLQGDYTVLVDQQVV